MRMKHLLLVQLLVWTAFILADFVEETFLLSYNITSIICFCVPIVIVVLYFIRREKEMSLRKRIIQIVILIFEWSVITLGITIFITAMVINDTWIIQQYRYSLELMFNGLEYSVFGGFLLLVPIAVVFVAEIALMIKEYCSYRKLHS